MEGTLLLISTPPFELGIAERKITLRTGQLKNFKMESPISEKNAVTIADRITRAPSYDVSAVEKLTGSKHLDVGWDAYREALRLDPAERDIIAARVKRKLDMILMSMVSILMSLGETFLTCSQMCFVYFLSYLDKQTLNYANTYGLQKDLGLTGNDYSWIVSITNIGYFVCAYPSNIALQKLPIRKFVAGNLMLWGAILMLTCVAKDFAGIMALRFVSGGAEACIACLDVADWNVFRLRYGYP